LRTEASKPRVLLIAEAANPEWVSVPLLGWSHARALSKVADVHLVTQVRNREAILRAGLGEDAFTALDTEAVAAPLYKAAEVLRGGDDKGWTVVTAMATLAYPFFERETWKRFRDRLLAREFDLVHRLTPLSPSTPSPLAKKLARVGVPFVLGPLNGGVPWPKGFEHARAKEKEWLSHLRSAHKLLPAYAATRRHAAAILAGSRTTLAEIPERWRSKCVYLPENGIDPGLFLPRDACEASGRSRDARSAPGPLPVAFVGRLVPLKGADMLLEAAAPLVRDGKVRLDVIGDGPERDGLRAMASREAIGSGVRIEGWVPHDVLRSRLAESEVFAFPSIREFGGGAVLEAMAVGLAPVVVDYGGPAELVTSECGVAIPLGSREAIVRALRQSLARLASDRGLARTLGARARERVLRHFTWDAKAAQVLEVYRWVLGRRAEKPDFGMPLGS
jgi:glycosyltransferase involved in cell wall biosynthesis